MKWVGLGDVFGDGYKNVGLTEELLNGELPRPPCGLDIILLL